MTVSFRKIIRRSFYIGIAGFALWLLFGRVAPAPISDDLSKLEPERCEPSSITTLLTAIVPMNIGSPTNRLDAEQIALVNEYKPAQRRKLWVLRMPAAYIMQRTCDLGRKNWVGTGDYIQFTQIYGLGFIIVDDRVVPETRATGQERHDGIPVFVQLTNKVRRADLVHQSYAKSSYLLGSYHGVVTCAEQPSAIPGLMTFKRVSPEIRHVMDCEGQYYRTGVYARKVADRSYDVVIGCAVRCEMRSDYNGWAVHFSFDRSHLEQWQVMHDRVTQFLADHTFHLDRDS